MSIAHQVACTIDIRESAKHALSLLTDLYWGNNRLLGLSDAASRTLTSDSGPINVRLSIAYVTSSQKSQNNMSIIDTRVLRITYGIYSSCLRDIPLFLPSRYVREIYIVHKKIVGVPLRS